MNKPKLLLGLALVLSGGLFGCSTTYVGQVKLSVENYDGTNAVCVVTNSTKQEVYINPICTLEQFHAPSNYPELCGIFGIGKWNDLIPLPPKASIKFTLIFARPVTQPWRLNCAVYNEYFPIYTNPATYTGFVSPPTNKTMTVQTSILQP